MDESGMGPDHAGAGRPSAGAVAAPDPKAARSRGRRLWRLGVGLGLAAAVGGLAYWALHRQPHGRSEAIHENGQVVAAPGPKEAPGVRVEVVRPKAGGMKRTTTQPGSVHPFEYSTIYAKVSGYLSRQTVDIGDPVQAGHLLAEIDVPELHKAVDQAKATLEDVKAQRKQAEARLESAKAVVVGARSSVDQAKSEVERTTAEHKYRRKALERIRELAQRHSVEARLVDEEEDRYEVAVAAENRAKAGVELAEAQLLEARAKADQAQADLEEAEASIRVAEADLAKAEVMAGYTRIVSPYDGVVTQRGFHRGDFIRSAAEGANGEPLLTIARTDKFRVVARVPERDAAFLKAGDPAVLKVGALGGRLFEGTVSRTSQAEDPRDRTMRAEVDLPNPDGSLVGGMYGYLTIVLEPATSNLTIPSSCLRETRGDGTGIVYVVRDGKAHEARIQVGRDNGVDVEVLAGIGPDDLVIDRGVGTISEGTRVRWDQPEQIAQAEDAATRQ
jgi:HlyD family secretion protein